MHRQIYSVGAEERDPEMPLAERLVEHAPGDLRPPVIDRTEHDQNRRHAHHHMKMRDHEVGIRQRQVDGHVTEEQAGQATVNEGEDESDREQHRHVR